MGSWPHLGPDRRARAGRPRRRAVALAIAVVSAGVLVASGCQINQVNLAAVDRLAPDAPLPAAPDRTDVAYGPDELQRLDVWLPAGPAVGTVVYFHSGGWVGGDKASVSRFVLDETSRGFAVVSVDHRLAGTATTALVAGGAGTVRAPEIMADADRAIRFVKANAADLGLDTTPLVAAGGSAGGWIAAMLGAAPGLAVDPQLPPELAAQSPTVGGVIALSAPSDLTTLWQAGGLGLSTETELLGCDPDPEGTTVPPTTVPPTTVPTEPPTTVPTTDPPTTVPPTTDPPTTVPPTPGLPTCTTDQELFWSPSTWALLHAFLGIPLPPAYIGVGALDLLVAPATQGQPLVDRWSAAAGTLRAWYDVPPDGGHNVDEFLNRSAFAIWNAMVVAGTL